MAYPALPKKSIRIHPANNKEYSSVYFDLRQYFRVWRDMFYLGKVKIFPKSLHLDPLALAVWYMDDGCFTGVKTILATDGFISSDKQYIQELLLRNFDLKTIIGKDGKLTIRKESHKSFFNLISPYIISCMHYKIPNPVTTSST